MKFIDVSSDVGLRMDVDEFVIAQEREDLVFYSLEPIRAQIDEYDVIATGLVNSLTASKPLIETFPGRERAHFWAGMWTNAFYGFTVAMILLALVTVVVLMRGG
ncbi:MAG TPA: tetrahydromethanopterin S-methyltransferase subunit B [Candidatus Acidoferrales bacterium]|nr:tetrahydromethanopterin S-methyltransferase subunit B [Candidatus Acidoferrales bacterium]